ncbi:hypothetical protein Ndes2437B_g01737 [Nannochloris sp. 'desiccata']
MPAHYFPSLKFNDLISSCSIRNQIRLLATSLRLKAATLSSAYPIPAEWLLHIPAVAQLLEDSLENLSCYLQDFSVLERFHNLRELQLLCSERREIEDGVAFSWDLGPQQAASLSQLQNLTKLSVVGFTTVELNTVDIAHLKELTINFQTTRGTLETQNRCTFSLPKDCLLDKVTILGPEDQETDPEEEGAFSITTNIDLDDVVNKCKFIHISGASIVLGINSFIDLDHLTAAATCIVTATRWIELRIELIKYLEDLDNIDPDLCVYHGDQGTEQIFIKGGLVEAINTAAHAQRKNISCEIIEEFVPLGFDSTMDLSGSDSEDNICSGKELRREGSVVISGMMSITLLVQRKW